ncbi:hypothetical protein FNH22_12475 [Fulvivirga sp. M361]|uniref:hypothetical protein n=1 Tax=Fulvivirga sp. M361 TaxID=2594266 RepID=UPI00117B6B0F|nr:hypothetical protein [Fulvivirga sp. M361]TRX58687.1 hypothetical protein FNH22_12475 [Fulvivirga sp. M361]
MRKDIDIPQVKNVTVAIARKKDELNNTGWKVYLINQNQVDIENTLVTSKGYGQKNGEEQKTSVLRHFLETVEANGTALIESIQPEVFHLNNEYWVSYYIGGELFDKRFVFVPESISEKNLTFIKELEMDGILHS